MQIRLIRFLNESLTEPIRMRHELLLRTKKDQGVGHRSAIKRNSENVKDQYRNVS